MSTISWRPLLAVCASLICFVSFADAPTTFQDTLGITHEAAANVPAPTFRNPPPGSRPAQLGHPLERAAINASGVDHTPVKTEALTQGERVADYVYFRANRPTR